MYVALAVIDRAYRGAVEAQYFDALYGVREFHRLLGRIDVALRGMAVTYAVPAPAYKPVLRLGSTELDTMPDYRRSVADLVADGISVFVDAPDLVSLGLGDAELVPGVRRADTSALAARWPEYDGVWFL